MSVTVNGSPNRVYNNGIEGKDKNLEEFHTDNRFGLLIDLHSTAHNTMYSSGTCLVNTKDRVHLENKRKTSGPGNLKCYIFTISDTQMNIMDSQLQSVQF